MTKYSIIVPVYNRPDEVGELLQSLSQQTLKDFEVIIVEDGSTTPCKDVCDKYAGILDLHYYAKENSGPGQSRNYGAERAQGEWLIVLDSDVVLPEGYLSSVECGVESGECGVESGEWRVNSVECRVDSVEWRVNSVECRVDSVEFATATDSAQTRRAEANSKLNTLNSTLNRRAVANSTLSTLNSKLNTQDSTLYTLNSKLNRRAVANSTLYTLNSKLNRRAVANSTLSTLNSKLKCDAWGGPDAAHPDFTPMQKAISYSMTSFFTTGGIRGGKAKLDKFYPRSYNMGIRSEVYHALGGFSRMRFGEDIDFSYRIVEAGYKTRLIPEAWVWHKRRTDLHKFFRQVCNSGRARINLTKRHPGTLKLVHLLPTVFTLGVIALVLLSAIGRLLMYYVDNDQWRWLCLMPWLPIVLYSLIILTDATVKNKSLKVGLLSVPAAFTQLMGYGLGFIEAWWKRCVLKQPEEQPADMSEQERLESEQKFYR